MKKRKLKKGPIIGLIIIILLGIVLAYLLINMNKEEMKNEEVIKTSEKKEEKKEPKKMSLVAVGDCLIHGAVYIDAKTGYNTYDFSGMLTEVKPLIEKYDLKYYNQETIIGGKNLGVSH